MPLRKYVQTTVDAAVEGMEAADLLTVIEEVAAAPVTGAGRLCTDSADRGVVFRDSDTGKPLTRHQALDQLTRVLIARAGNDPNAMSYVQRVAAAIALADQTRPDLRKTAAAVRRAQARVDKLASERDTAILAELASGKTMRQVAELSGLTVGRIGQIAQRDRAAQ